MAKRNRVSSAPVASESGDSFPWKWVLAAVLVLGVLAVANAVGWLNFNPSTPPVSWDPDLAKGDHTRGNPAAKVIIVEFSDFQCPACGVAFAPTEALLKRYEGEVFFVYRHFPLTTLHPLAVPAAEASECAADQNRFWDLHDALFSKQSVWVPEGKDGIRALASESGLDMDLFDACLASRKKIGVIQSDMDAGVQFGVNSTPTFFVNGLRIDGFNQSQIESAVESALK